MWLDAISLPLLHYLSMRTLDLDFAILQLDYQNKEKKREYLKDTKELERKKRFVL